MSNLLKGIKNASYLAGGNLIVQIITFIGFIYIARILGPDNYGIYVTVGAFVGIFDIIYLEKTIGLRNLLILAAIITCIGCSFFMPYKLQTRLYIILYSAELAYAGIKGFFGIIYQAIEKMQYISILDIVNKALFVSLSIAFLYHGFGLLTLFLLALFSHFSTLIINYSLSRRFIRFNLFSKIQFDKNLLKPALIFSLMVFVGFLITRVDLLMISFLGTAKDVGVYGVANKIAQQGVMLRNVTVTAFFPIFVKKFHKGTIKVERLVKPSLFFLGGIFILSLTASFFVEHIITFLFGMDYKNSGEILRVLIFYLAFTWATLPFTTAAQATHNENYMLVALLIMAGLNIPLNYILFIKYGLIGIAYSTLLVNSVGGFLMCSIIYRVMKLKGHLA